LDGPYCRLFCFPILIAPYQVWLQAVFLFPTINTFIVVLIQMAMAWIGVWIRYHTVLKREILGGAQPVQDPNTNIFQPFVTWHGPS
jgi:hypothetical protein